MVPLVVISAGRPRSTTIHNLERVKLVATTLHCILLLAPFYAALAAASLTLADHKNF